MYLDDEAQKVQYRRISRHPAFRVQGLTAKIHVLPASGKGYSREIEQTLKPDAVEFYGMLVVIRQLPNGHQLKSMGMKLTEKNK